jgi:hypothetical protein
VTASQSASCDCQNFGLWILVEAFGRLDERRGVFGPSVTDLDRHTTIP